MVKIGYSDDPHARIRDLQVGCPYKLKLIGTRPGSRKEEKSLHSLFYNHRLHGEWYQGHEEVLDFVKYCTKSQGV